jgi:hypothetical protein
MTEKGLPVGFPEIPFTPAEMQQKLQTPVMWLRDQNRAATLGEYIAARLPHLVSKLGVMVAEVPEIGDVHDLSEDDWKNLALAQLESMTKERDDIRGHSVGDLIEAVKQGTDLGAEQLGYARRSRDLILELADADKLRVDPNRRPRDRFGFSK